MDGGTHAHTGRHYGVTVPVAEDILAEPYRPRLDTTTSARPRGRPGGGTP